MGKLQQKFTIPIRIINGRMNYCATLFVVKIEKKVREINFNFHAKKVAHLTLIRMEITFLPLCTIIDMYHD